MCCLDVQNAPFEHFRKRCAVGVCTLSSRQGRVWGGFGNSNLAAIVNFLKIQEGVIEGEPESNSLRKSWPSGGSTLKIERYSVFKKS